MFEIALWRYATSGTLILAYALVDHFARHGRGASPAPPRWLRPMAIASVLGFYVLIEPAGGALLGGFGNAAGIALAVLALVLRSSRAVAYPDLAGRTLFYTALPIAVGVPWGLLVLSAPAVAASVYCCVRAERLRASVGGFEALRARYRLLPGIW